VVRSFPSDLKKCFGFTLSWLFLHLSLFLLHPQPGLWISKESREKVFYFSALAIQDLSIILKNKNRMKLI
jgi:hypothetical protein